MNPPHPPADCNRRAGVARQLRLATPSLLLAILAVLAPTPASARSGQPPTGKTGAPGVPGPEGKCNEGGCHVGNPLNDPASGFVIQLLDGLAPFTRYTLGNTYVLTFELNTTRTDRRRWGFEVTCLTSAGGARAGTFTDLNERTNVQISGTRQYVGHGSPPVTTADGTFNGTTATPVTWTFQWEAPTTSPAPDVTFYYCVNAANGTGSTGGDFISCGTIAVTADVGAVDTDGDTLLDSAETTLGTSATDADTDDDGLSDGVEVNSAAATDPVDCDSDDDGLSDGYELGVTTPGRDTDLGPGGCFLPDPSPALTTDPLSCDTDGDELHDGLEEGVTAPLPDTDIGPSGCYQADLDGETTDSGASDTDGDSPDGVTCLDGTEDANQNGQVDAGESDPNVAGDCPLVAGIELRIDGRTTRLSGGPSATCGPKTIPPMGNWLLTPCNAPQRFGCVVAPTLPTTRTELLIVDPGNVDLTLPGEAAAAFEPGVLTLYELDGCGQLLLISRDGSDLLVDTR